MPPDISVIIAAYNVESYIERAIRSALDQQNVTVEVIVVNDASTDETFAVTTRIGDPRLKCLNLETNHGPGGARNAGLYSASAPWIAVLDGDDVFLPGRLARLLERAKTKKVDIVVDNLLVHREADGADYPMFKTEWLSKRAILDLATFIAENRMFQTGSTMGYFKPVFAADFLRKNALAYDTELRIGEDYLLLAEALARGAVCAIESIAGYQYTVRIGSTSHRLSTQDVERIIDGDKNFLARVRLDAKAMAAQKRRSESLLEAYAYTKLVDAIKQRNVGDMLGALKIYPRAAIHLWEPVWVRIKRIVG